MNIILTGITGNIGYEVARILLREGHTVIPIVRSKAEYSIPERLKELNADFSQISEHISADLEHEVPHHALTNVDCIIHCAGVVHFRKAGSSNELMMRNLLTFAKDTKIPIYYVSTAYIYKPNNEPLFNRYEVDKDHAENILISSSLPHTILRPSIVTGNSQTGEIIHFSGYYLMVPAFIGALTKADKIRFPSIQNQVNIIPVDWVAQSIVDVVKNKKEGTLYITNPNPPTFNTLLLETLKFFKLDNKLEIIECTLEEYKKMDLSSVERDLFNFCVPFLPYLTTHYNFPSSLCTHGLSSDYIQKILSYFKHSQDEKLEK